MSAQTIEPAPKHNECLHPNANGSDDFSGVSCCMCERRPCKDVSLAMIAEHAAFTRHLYGLPEQHFFEGQPGSSDCKHCGMENLPTLHLQPRGQHDTPSLTVAQKRNEGWQRGDVVRAPSGHIFQARGDGFGGLEWLELSPSAAHSQLNPPTDAVLLVRDGEAVCRCLGCGDGR